MYADIGRLPDRFGPTRRILAIVFIVGVLSAIGGSVLGYRLFWILLDLIKMILAVVLALLFRVEVPMLQTLPRLEPVELLVMEVNLQEDELDESWGEVEYTEEDIMDQPLEAPPIWVPEPLPSFELDLEIPEPSINTLRQEDARESVMMIGVLGTLSDQGEVQSLFSALQGDSLAEFDSVSGSGVIMAGDGDELSDAFGAGGLGLASSGEGVAFGLSGIGSGGGGEGLGGLGTRGVGSRVGVLSGTTTQLSTLDDHGPIRTDAKVVSIPRARLPVSLRELHDGARCSAVVMLDGRGVAERVRVTKCPDELVDIAKMAAEKGKYVAATLDGEPTGGKLEVTIQFR